MTADMTGSDEATMSGSDGGWSDYWVNEGAAGEVFVNAHGQKHPALAAFWAEVFSDIDAGARVIDLASGAGSIYAHLLDEHGFELYATDISAEALRLLEERIPGVRTVVCNSYDAPFDDRSFDLVVSQFGIEYSGLDAFGEAGRLVAAGGKLVALCHYKDGYIDSRNSAELGGAGVAAETAFIDRAIELTEAAFARDCDALVAAEQDFIPAERALAAAVLEQRRGVHAHLYAGFRQLYEKRQLYHKADITTWLTQMRGELDKNLHRLECMCGAALSRVDMNEVRDRLGACGLSRIIIEPFVTPGNDLPIAWDLRAARR